MTSPLIISTWSFGQRGNDRAWPALMKGGTSLDAVERVCIVVEADPEVDSVGFGGLPDASGRVSLDGCIMIGPGVGHCGSAVCVRRFLHPVSIARRIMEKTPHIMLAGDGAEAFAEQEGFLHADLLSAEASDAYRAWSRDHAAPDQSRDRGYVAPRPIDHGGSAGGRLFFHPAPPAMMRADAQSQPSLHIADSPAKSEAGEEPWKHHDTIGVLALDSRSVLAGACSTSGTPYKTPGRVGDSPIIGHGLYVDPVHGAAVATGTGELIMSVCATFLAVESLRRGEAPLNAVRIVLERIVEQNNVLPQHQVALIAMRPDGTHASAALRPGYKTSIVDSAGSRVIEPDAVLLP